MTTLFALYQNIVEFKVLSSSRWLSAFVSAFTQAGSNVYNTFALYREIYRRLDTLRYST